MKRALAIAASLAVLFVSTAASADVVELIGNFDEDLSWTSGGASAGSASNLLCCPFEFAEGFEEQTAQSFRLSHDSNLYSFQVALKQIGTLDAVSFFLTGSSTSPGGHASENGNIGPDLDNYIMQWDLVDGLNSSFQIITFEFTSPFIASADIDYWIVMTPKADLLDQDHMWTYWLGDNSDEDQGTYFARRSNIQNEDGTFPDLAPQRWVVGLVESNDGRTLRVFGETVPEPSPLLFISLFGFLLGLYRKHLQTTR